MLTLFMFRLLLLPTVGLDISRDAAYKFMVKCAFCEAGLLSAPHTHTEFAELSLHI